MAVFDRIRWSLQKHAKKLSRFIFTFCVTLEEISIRKRFEQLIYARNIYRVSKILRTEYFWQNSFEPLSTGFPSIVPAANEQPNAAVQVLTVEFSEMGKFEKSKNRLLDLSSVPIKEEVFLKIWWKLSARRFPMISVDSSIFLPGPWAIHFPLWHVEVKRSQGLPSGHFGPEIFGETSPSASCEMAWIPP